MVIIKHVKGLFAMNFGLLRVISVMLSHVQITGASI